MIQEWCQRNLKVLIDVVPDVGTRRDRRLTGVRNFFIVFQRG